MVIDGTVTKEEIERSSFKKDHILILFITTMNHGLSVLDQVNYRNCKVQFFCDWNKIKVR